MRLYMLTSASSAEELREHVEWVGMVLLSTLVCLQAILQA
jgi:hypothetical protein